MSVAHLWQERVARPGERGVWTPVNEGAEGVQQPCHLHKNASTQLQINTSINLDTHTHAQTHRPIYDCMIQNSFMGKEAPPLPPSIFPCCNLLTIFRSP